MKKIILLITSLIYCHIIHAQSQTASATQDVNMQLSDAIEISFLATGTDAGNNVNFNFTTVNNYKNGVISGTQGIKVRTNKKFIVRVKTNSSNFSYNGDVTPTPSMPVTGVLSLKVISNSTGGSIVSPFTTYGGLTATGQPVISNGTAGGDQEFSIKYKATPGFSYPQGTYTVDVVYTATQS